MFSALKASSSKSLRPLIVVRPLLRTPISSNPYLYIRQYSQATPGDGLDEGEQAIHDKLLAAFPGTRLEVQDVSGGCGSFYAILIQSPKFNGLSTIKQHKLVNECLKDDIKSIHGLQLKTIPE